MSNWKDMFEEQRRERSGGATSPPPAPVEYEEQIAPDLAHYQPWIIQRGRSRPALLLNLRKFDPRSGLLIGWQASYPYLVAADYVGERMLSLDFGSRQFIIQGNDLTELVRHLQQGTVLAIQEYSAQIWPTQPNGPVVTAISKIEARGQPDG
ncbi:MAG: hypothetical protein QOD42_3732 [Sphingomonadales bacterium]|jgi:hypothetical protein|nr:hypothetical protein [Sphingomonadales bacterium]